jgi:hydrogenase-4 component B
MTTLTWTFAALALAALGLAVPAKPLRHGAFVLGSWAAALLVLIGAAQTLMAGAATHSVPAALSILPGFTFALNPLRAFFLAIAAGVYGLSAAFVASDASRFAPARARLVLGFTALLFAAMVTVLLAAGVTSLIFGWEIMSLSLAALVFLGGRSHAANRAGLVTLAFS